MMTVAVIPKEYFEKNKSKNINNKHKGIRKSTAGMSSDGYASRIMSLHEHETVSKNSQIKVQKQFQVKNGTMKMTSITKCQFAGRNHVIISLTKLFLSLLAIHFWKKSDTMRKNQKAKCKK